MRTRRSRIIHLWFITPAAALNLPNLHNYVRLVLRNNSRNERISWAFFVDIIFKLPFFFQAAVLWLREQQRQEQQREQEQQHFLSRDLSPDHVTKSAFVGWLIEFVDSAEKWKEEGDRHFLDISAAQEWPTLSNWARQQASRNIVGLNFFFFFPEEREMNFLPWTRN